MIKREWLLGVGLLSGGIGLGLGTVIATQPAEAQTANTIGAIAAVKPDAYGTAPNAAEQVLNIGAGLTENERIRTNENGTANLIFADRSSLTVGKGSEVVLDKFVYDPASKSGELAVSIGQGALRFIGGQLSKSGSVQIKTQTATLTVRGGIVLIGRLADGSYVAVLLYGNELHDVTHDLSVFRAGFALRYGADGAPLGGPTRITDAELADLLKNFNTETGIGGKLPDEQVVALENDLQGQDMQQLISDLRGQIDDLSQRNNTVLDSLKQFMIVDTVATS
ncbi:MAG TPA: FecR domain-containing protein [Dongiaceae bacterium]|jgi:hypothetical protein